MGPYRYYSWLFWATIINFDFHPIWSYGLWYAQKPVFAEKCKLFGKNVCHFLLLKSYNLNLAGLVELVKLYNFALRTTLIFPSWLEIQVIEVRRSWPRGVNFRACQKKTQFEFWSETFRITHKCPEVYFKARKKLGFVFEIALKLQKTEKNDKKFKVKILKCDFLCINDFKSG